MVGAGSLEAGELMWLVWEHHWLFLVGRMLKGGQQIRKVVVIDHVSAVQVRLPQ